MAVKDFKIVFPGQVTVVPRIGHLYAPNNTLAQITTAGFLTSYVRANSISLLPTDVLIAYGSNGTQWYKPVFGANRVITLTALP